jgi:hypothetical protein
MKRFVVTAAMVSGIALLGVGPANAGLENPPSTNVVCVKGISPETGWVCEPSGVEFTLIHCQLVGLAPSPVVLVCVSGPLIGA